MLYIARALAATALVVLSACSQKHSYGPSQEQTVEWRYYGGDAGGQRYSSASQITPQNVRDLRVAWTFSTGDVASKGAEIRHAAFENTPIMVAGRLYLCSPFNEAFALDPATGERLWSFDPQIDPKVHYPNSDNCRGVAYWLDPEAAPEAACRERIFMATNDRRLIALDATTGQRCAQFGQNGVVDVAPGIVLHRPGEMQITSAPVVSHGVVVVGSSLDDNQRVQEVSGAVRAFDARTGAPRWTWDPLSSALAGVVAGAANVWAPMSVDEARGLVFLPTTSPSPDFWGGLRPGDAGDADSIVVLNIETGERVWAFHTVHHDVWDYDNPAQPTLGMVAWQGEPRPAVLAPTKQGLLFTLNRESGDPLIPVEERPVPQGGAPGDVLSPTQPFPVAPRPLTADKISAGDAWGLTPWDRGVCRRRIAAARSEGLYTPPSTQGTIIFPFTGGGVNWGGLAFDEAHQTVFVNTSSLIHLVALIPHGGVRAAKKAEPRIEISRQEGAPFGMRREVLRSPLGLPCNSPPWGELHAIDMRTGNILWEVPLGTTKDLFPGSQFILRGTGVPNFGGPMVTATGLVFIGATLDNYLRAFDAATGRELWRGRLPGGGQATPMTYVWQGRQYVVVAAGGHSQADTRRNDKLVAFALPATK